MTSFPASASRGQHLDWLLEITQIPTAAGREWRVIEWIRRWVAARPGLRITADRAGNLVVDAGKRLPTGGRGAGSRNGKPAAPIYITAHLDHPAFVVERVIGPGTVELSFRGGVMDVYFEKARVRVHMGDEPGTPGGRPESSIEATLTGEGDGVAAPDGSRLFKTYIAELDERADEDRHATGPDVRVGDVATWALEPASVDENGVVHTAACDDLAALAAAVSAFDTLVNLAERGEAVLDVRLLFTRSEEIGFTGAIAACQLKTMPEGARVIALENSRSFVDSPIGGGPIVRVGDRMSIFDPALTAACAKRAEEISGHASVPTASQRNSDVAGWKWQRKLMAGGACEATVFCTYGYKATCLCLPLGNYHNMADLAEVQAGTFDAQRKGPPRVGREFIHRDDYHGLVDLLVAIGQSLPEGGGALERIEKLFEKTRGVLGPMGGEARGAGAAGAARGRNGAVKKGAKVRAAAKPPAGKAATVKKAAGKKPAARGKVGRRAQR